jgi:hypothetical protein
MNSPQFTPESDYSARVAAQHPPPRTQRVFRTGGLPAIRPENAQTLCEGHFRAQNRFTLLLKMPCENQPVIFECSLFYQA